MFATKVWGFDAENWPVIVFGHEGDRERLLRLSSPGDRITFVATKGDEVDEEERGRILGVAEIGRTEVNTLDVLAPEAIRPEHLTAEGLIRWPKALPMVRAWRVIDPPEVRQLLGRQLTQYAVRGAELLKEDEAALVDALAMETVELPASATLERERRLVMALSANRGPTTGPRPTDWTASVESTVAGPACTYVLRFADTEIWKVGWTSDLKNRIRVINEHLPTEVIGAKYIWAAVFKQQFPDRESAWRMEQELLERLKQFRTQGERVRCSESVISREFQAAVRG